MSSLDFIALYRDLLHTKRIFRVSSVLKECIESPMCFAARGQATTVELYKESLLPFLKVPAIALAPQRVVAPVHGPRFRMPQDYVPGLEERLLSDPDPSRSALRYDDLIIWAVLVGSRELAECFWVHPLRAQLLQTFTSLAAASAAAPARQWRALPTSPSRAVRSDCERERFQGCAVRPHPAGAPCGQRLASRRFKQQEPGNHRLKRTTRRLPGPTRSSTHPELNSAMTSLHSSPHLIHLSIASPNQTRAPLQPYRTIPQPNPVCQIQPPPHVVTAHPAPPYLHPTSTPPTYAPGRRAIPRECKGV